MTTRATHPPVPPLSAQTRFPHSRTNSRLPHEAVSLVPTLPPAFEAFCALNRDSYLDYARAHLPHSPARRLVCSLLGELAVGWLNIVSNPNPPARAWMLLRTRVQSAASHPTVLETCPAQQYDALVLHCRLGYSSAQAATVMGVDPSKIRYLVLSASSEHRQAVRHLHPLSPAPRAA
ncbi:hypothetical protein PO587_38860 [Streptomyces gilvifuscus]|uniref:RNA polymerase sigma factor 70 region 4 type 2 domain-containing protein n=1 Tax=Streptomyces gilvifuscus TaxID=1550617 RepID=A0ABT5G729_9ACTN|nr:hypothetical protein [Streptomyces gilvifuscus]MDC2960402.1 hypothetical protein [Streptomyces gilvifuscus]